MLFFYTEWNVFYIYCTTNDLTRCFAFQKDRNLTKPHYRATHRFKVRIDTQHVL